MGRNRLQVLVDGRTHATRQYIADVLQPQLNASGLPFGNIELVSAELAEDPSAAAAVAQGVMAYATVRQALRKVLVRVEATDPDRADELELEFLEAFVAAREFASVDAARAWFDDAPAEGVTEDPPAPGGESVGSAE